MNDAVGMGRRERIGNLNRQCQGAAGRNRTAVRDFAERSPEHQLHREVRPDPVGLADVIDGDDVRMIQRRGGTRFTNETLARERIRLFRGQHFDGEVAFQPRIASAIDYAHPADADLTDDFVRTEARPRGNHST